MTRQPVNPFSITRAADFSDQEIHDYWVNYPDGGLVGLASPTSSMPMLILGGKGSGKTHLMRYFSFSLQKIRHAANLEHGLIEEGYLAIYLRCGGLNGGRFRHKGQDEDVWSTIFAYYMEIWLAQLVLDIAREVISCSAGNTVEESKICHEIIDLLDNSQGVTFSTLETARDYFKSRQRILDFQINNSAMNKKLDFQIEASPGRLVFGIPKILASSVPSLAHIVFLFLIDEFENLQEYQQQYVNTLLRENESPSSIKIGSKLYGVRTLRTNSADEVNTEGSEFEVLRLDSRMRSMSHYAQFAKRLIARRPAEHGYASITTGDENSVESSLEKWFESSPRDKYASNMTSFVQIKYQGQERPYFRALRKKLARGIRTHRAPGLSGEEDLDRLIAHLAYPQIPLLEKVNCYLLYKDWPSSIDLLETAEAIGKNLVAYIAESDSDGKHKEAMSKFKYDLLAQLLKECDQKQRYAGIKMFIDMSMGFPRNLLNILKNVYSWSLFNGKLPFVSEPISLEDQAAGVRDAVEWFYRDSQATGPERNRIKESINRLGTFFRRIRFSDNPSECSLSTFSYDTGSISETSREIIECAKQWSLLIDVGDQRDRNQGRLDVKLQLNPMLAPRWDLSIYQRGVIVLSSEELEGIFGSTT